MRTHRRIAIAFWILGMLGPAASIRAEEVVATLTLDGLSFVSFQDEQVLHFPAGSTIAFRFGEPRADGSVAFTIAPADVEIGTIELPDGRTLRYDLAATASGSMRPTSDGRVIEFQAPVVAELSGESGGALRYSIPFTTETATARDLLGTREVEVTGLRLVEGAWYAQLVGATRNRANAFPKPGAAVYTVLSGSFDRLP